MREIYIISIIIIWDRVEVLNTENKVGLLYLTQDLVTVFMQSEFKGKDEQKLFSLMFIPFKFIFFLEWPHSQKEGSEVRHPEKELKISLNCTTGLCNCF